MSTFPCRQAQPQFHETGAGCGQGDGIFLGPTRCGRTRGTRRQAGRPRHSAHPGAWVSSSLRRGEGDTAKSLKVPSSDGCSRSLSRCPQAPRSWPAACHLFHLRGLPTFPSPLPTREGMCIHPLEHEPGPAGAQGPLLPGPLGVHPLPPLFSLNLPPASSCPQAPDKRLSSQDIFRGPLLIRRHHFFPSVTKCWKSRAFSFSSSAQACMVSLLFLPCTRPGPQRSSVVPKTPIAPQCCSALSPQAQPGPPCGLTSTTGHRAPLQASLPPPWLLPCGLSSDAIVGSSDP